ncbi:MAG: hypothetical protein MPK03_02785 [Alphaproteobacteria bacterium]|nr:hypothetical protein [Alphaproteobacteria bacterium]MDA8010185.1 hypothetical protein [Alphaproteobacteria bacterium]
MLYICVTTRFPATFAVRADLNAIYSDLPRLRSPNAIPADLHRSRQSKHDLQQPPPSLPPSI